MPRQVTPTPPRERFTIPQVRKAWSTLRPATINVAARHLWLTSRMIKHRRHDSDPGQFPDPIPVAGHYHQAGQLYDLTLLEMWRDNGYDLRAGQEDPSVALRQAVIDEAVETAEPLMLTMAAELLVADILPDLRGAQLTDARREIKAWKRTWERSGVKPAMPARFHQAQRRLRNWRETWSSNGFPPALPIEADYRNAEMIFSLPELRGWLEERNGT